MYEDQGVVHQETCFYHWLNWPSGVAVTPGRAVRDHVFAWLSLDGLDGHRFLPPEIAPFLTGAARGTHLFVDRRRGSGS